MLQKIILLPWLKKMAEDMNGVLDGKKDLDGTIKRLLKKT